MKIYKIFTTEKSSVYLGKGNHGLLNMTNEQYPLQNAILAGLPGAILQKGYDAFHNKH